VLLDTINQVVKGRIWFGKCDGELLMFREEEDLRAKSRGRKRVLCLHNRAKTPRATLKSRRGAAFTRDFDLFWVGMKI
jgi:hypothetical protein